jgi:hypothetical protein
MIGKKEGLPPVYQQLMAGCLSGALGALVCNPIEVVKTRLQAEVDFRGFRLLLFFLFLFFFFQRVFLISSLHRSCLLAKSNSDILVLLMHSRELPKRYQLLYFYCSLTHRKVFLECGVVFLLAWSAVLPSRLCT